MVNHCVISDSWKKLSPREFVATIINRGYNPREIAFYSGSRIVICHHDNHHNNSYHNNSHHNYHISDISLPSSIKQPLSTLKICKHHSGASQIIIQLSLNHHLTINSPLMTIIKPQPLFTTIMNHYSPLGSNSHYQLPLTRLIHHYQPLPFI